MEQQCGFVSGGALLGAERIVSRGAVRRDGQVQTRVACASRRPAVPVMCAAAAQETVKEDELAKTLSASTSSMETVLDTIEIMKVLPHRYPFLLVDKIVHYEPGVVAIGVKNVSMNEPQFTGHFPDRPIMPGVLMIEAMAQVGGIVMLQEPITDGKGEFFFAGIDNVKWRKPVVPGDTLVMQMDLKAFKARFGIGKMSGKAYVDGVLAVEGDFTFAYVAPKK